MEQEYQVTARKWRPQRFDEVVGQDHITRTLKNAIRENRLAHAYLFTGQRGCGKTTVARILAKAINCPNAATNNYEPCNLCDVCKGITNGSSMDVAEIDGASNNGVDDVRDLRENVKYPPLQGSYRVIIIDEVHMLTPAAFNALLKTLEEPPRHLVFILATTEAQKLLPTILSRTQRYDFRRMQIDEIVARLRHIAVADAITTDDDSLLLIAKKADGSMRDAQSVFDQAVAFSGNNIRADVLRDALNLIDADFYFEITDAINEHAASKAFALSLEVVTRGYDIEEFIGGLLDHLRNLLTVIVTAKPQLLEVVKHHQERYTKDAASFNEGDVLRLTRIGFGALERIRTAHSARVVLELMLVEMTLLERVLDVKTLLEEIRSLKGNANSLPQASSSVTSAPKVSANAPVATADKKTTATKETTSVVVAVGDLNLIADQWSEFVASVAATSVPFRMIADDIEFTLLRQNIVEITVSKKHTEETFARNRDMFIAKLGEFFGNQSLGIELKKVEKKMSASSTSFKNPKSSAKPNNKQQTPEEPTVTIEDGIERGELELTLIKEFGATPL